MATERIAAVGTGLNSPTEAIGPFDAMATPGTIRQLARASPLQRAPRRVSINRGTAPPGRPDLPARLRLRGLASSNPRDWRQWPG
jgi:hypothetical protein